MLLSGCEEHLRPVSTFPAAPQQPFQAEIKENIIPVDYYTPAICRVIHDTSVWDNLLGQTNEIIVKEEQNTTTLAVPNEKHTGLLRLAQTRMLGTDTGSVLILAGVSFESNEPVTTGPFTFEFGNPMQGTELYTTGKESFLMQFSGTPPQKISNKIQGITGATMIWKPVAGQIKQMTAQLLRYGQDKAFIENIISQGTIWQREQQNPSADESITFTPAVYTTDANQIPFSLSVPAKQDFLMTHWNWVAAGELVLLFAMILILIFSASRRSSQ